MRLLAWITTSFLALPIFGAPERPHIVTSFFPLYCWTANIAGTNAEVINLLTARAEPHDYAFTPGDARRLANADLIVINGLGLEAWQTKFLRSSPSSAARVVTISAGLDHELIAAGHHEHQRAHANSHVWMDPHLAIHGVSNILAALGKINAPHFAGYMANAQAYLARLKQLDTEITRTLAGITNRAIVTYHDAFPYFARRYGLEVAAVVEQVPDVNPTPKYLSRLGQAMRARGIRVIFIAPNSTTRLARRIAEDLRVELVELDTLESGPLSPSAYEERMRHNAEVLRKHLN